jgi:hypothetical protein
MKNEVVTIKATEAVQKMAEQALAIQDACNPLPILAFLSEVEKHFRQDEEREQERSGTDMGHQNPIALALLNKLNDLAQLDQTRTDCFTACHDLQEGRDVAWPINFLA